MSKKKEASSGEKLRCYERELTNLRNAYTELLKENRQLKQELQAVKEETTTCERK